MKYESESSIRVCGICGCKCRKTRLLRKAARLLRDPSRTIYPAGTPICPLYRDSLFPADHPYFEIEDAQITRGLFMQWLDEIESWTKGRKPREMSDEEWTYKRSRVMRLKELANATSDEDLHALRDEIVPDLLRARGIDPDRDARAIWQIKATPCSAA